MKPSGRCQRAGTDGAAWARPAIATLRTGRLLGMMALLAWLSAFRGPPVPTLARDGILLSDAPFENEGAAEPGLVSQLDSPEPVDPPAVEPRAASQIGYDKGIYLRYSNAQSQSFELKTNGRIQLRYTAFSRADESWTDQAGVTREIRNRNYFDIERARLVFSGHAFVPEIKYFMQLDGDTDDGHTVEFFDCWWGYQFSEACQIQFGKRKVPAVRNWLLPAFETRLVDRPLATDFFRPDRTVGVWLVGQPTERLHYELMVGNAYRAINTPPAELNGQFAFGGTVSWDPWGPYGNGVVDFEQTDRPVVRVGHSWVFASQSGLDDFGQAVAGIRLPAAQRRHATDPDRRARPRRDRGSLRCLAERGGSGGEVPGLESECRVLLAMRSTGSAPTATYPTRVYCSTAATWKPGSL